MLNWYFFSNLLFHIHISSCVFLMEEWCVLFSVLFELLFYMYDYTCMTESLCMLESASSQGEITETCAVSMWDWYTGFLAWLFPWYMLYSKYCYFKKKRKWLWKGNINTCQRDMTALFFLLLSRMLVYKYIYSYCNMSIYIYAWIYMMNADEINKYSLWNLYNVLYIDYISKFSCTMYIKIQCILIKEAG